MATAVEQAQAHIGETKAMQDHDHDLVHELSKRLDSVWRYDQYIANAEGKDECQTMWRDMKKQALAHIDRLKALIKKEIGAGCF